MFAGLSEEDQKACKNYIKPMYSQYGYKKEGNGALAGITGQGKRVEAVSVRLEGYSKKI